MPTVFITNEPYRIDDNGVSRPVFNMSPAREFGDIEILVPAGASLLSTVPVVRLLRDKLRDFSDEDYLLPVGDPAIMAAAIAVASEFNNGRFKLLKWDRQSRTYDVVQIDTSGRALA